MASVKFLTEIVFVKILTEPKKKEERVWISSAFPVAHKRVISVMFTRAFDVTGFNSQTDATDVVTTRRSFSHATCAAHKFVLILIVQQFVIAAPITLFAAGGTNATIVQTMLVMRMFVFLHAKNKKKTIQRVDVRYLIPVRIKHKSNSHLIW